MAINRAKFDARTSSSFGEVKTHRHAHARARIYTQNYSLKYKLADSAGVARRASPSVTSRLSVSDESAEPALPIWVLCEQYQKVYVLYASPYVVFT